MKTAYAFLALALVATTAVLGQKPGRGRRLAALLQRTIRAVRRYPRRVPPDPPPENGDGLIFRDAGGMSITVSAMYNATQATLASERASDIETAGRADLSGRGAKLVRHFGPEGRRGLLRQVLRNAFSNLDPVDRVPGGAKIGLRRYRAASRRLVYPRAMTPKRR